MSRRLLLLCLLPIVAIFIGISLVWWVGGTEVPAQTFSIQTGDMIAQVPTRLGITVSPMLYRLWYHLQPPVTLQIGSYTLTGATTLAEVLHTTLRSHSSEDEQTITILPGWDLADIDEYLSVHHTIETGSIVHMSSERLVRLQQAYPFLAGAGSVEGYLMPDTYRIRSGASVDSILDTLLKAFDQKIVHEYPMSADQLRETLILASIVEREEKSPENKPIIAGILKKRIEKGIALGTDSTVCEDPILTQSQCTPAVIAKRIYSNSLYNTRSRKGLPPWPIASVSVETFRATVQSQDSAYLYYLHDTHGQIHYARTLEEHNVNKARYLGK